MNRALLVAMLAVVAAALVWGLSIVGGPGFARMEENDRTRAADLRRLGNHYRCANYNLTDSDKAISPGYCAQGSGPAPELTDPVTGAAYEYGEDGTTYFEVCATFEVPADHRYNRHPSIVFEGQRGCVTYYRDNFTAKWRLGPID